MADTADLRPATLAAQGIPFRVIPGITSGLAGLALASIPATIRGVNQAVILATGHGADTDIIVAAAKAYLSAINKLLAASGRFGNTEKATEVAIAEPVP